MSLRNLAYLFYFLLLSCSGPSKDSELKEKTNLLLGSWEGYKYYSGNSDSLEFQGYSGLDLIFKTDTVYRIDYPTYLVATYTYTVNGDSIHFLEDGRHSKYKWTVSDTLLSFEQQINASKIEMTSYRKKQFDSKVIQKIFDSQINEELLQSLKWDFDYPNTKRYGWTDIDTLIYTPPTDIYFKTTGNLYNDSYILMETDTFKLVRFRKLGTEPEDIFILQIERILKGRKIILSYSAEENNAP